MKTRETLYAHQKKAIEFIKRTPNCALWMDMGLGKTVVTETAYLDLLNSFDTQRALVIAPLRVARKVWIDEAREWGHLHGLNIAHIGGNHIQRKRALNTPADIHTVGRESAAWLVSEFVEGKRQTHRWPWDTVILDESQSFKSQSSQRWKALRLIRKLFPRCIELTGTPSPKDYGDLWSQIYLLDRGARLGTSESAYRDRWFEADLGDGYVTYRLKDHAEKEIQAALSDVVLSMKVEDYFDLPPIIYNAVKVKLSDKDMKDYRYFARHNLLRTMGGQTITAVNAGVAYGKLLQYANGAVYMDYDRQYIDLHSEKLDALIEVLEGINGPVLIGYNFVHDKKRIAAALDRYCGNSKRWSIMDTDDQLNGFSRGDFDIGLIHPATAGHGLNDLHKSGCENIIWFGLTSNLEHFQQLNGRIGGGLRRLNKNIRVHILVAEDTIDEHALVRLTEKAASQDGLTRAMVAFMKSTTAP